MRLGRVAPYGPVERRFLRRADEIFVRDRATAEDLRAKDVPAEAPGNVIVDLFASADDLRAADALAGFQPAIALFPGSREAAYEDALFLADVVRRCAPLMPELGAALSIAPMLDVERFKNVFAESWTVVPNASGPVAFELQSKGRALIRAWRGPLGPLLTRVQAVIGQAGTANEAAAAAGVPVVAFEHGADRKTAWYRMRQSGLLGEALAVLPGERDTAADELVALLQDEERRARMAATGREMMGPPGGARAIASAVAQRLPQ